MSDVRGRRIRGVVAGVLLLPMALGCYSTRMVVDGAVTPGSDVSLTITDKGRVGLAERLGPGVFRINGRLANRSSSEIVVRVNSVDYLGSASAVWAGEPVTVPTEYVGLTSERTLSRGRSWAAAALTLGAIIAAVLAFDVANSGTGRGGVDGGPTALHPN